MGENVKHTRGPWEVVQGSTTGRLVVSPMSPKSKRNVAHVGGPDRDANACLIAAAPELLEAARRLVSTYADFQDGNGEACQDVEFAKAAIAKAEARP